MSFQYCLIIVVGLIIPLCYIGAQTPSSSKRESLITSNGKLQVHVWEMRSHHHPKPSNADVSTTNPKPSRKRSTSHHQRQHLSNAHGILNIIGWGTLLPVGAIISRYFRKIPMVCDRWYSYHVFCQSAGYVLGSIGWFTGMLLGKLTKQQFGRSSHGILGTIIFILSTIQMVSMIWQPRKHLEQFRKCWDIFHRVLGYALITLIIVNIFEGINSRSKWMWVYVTILAVLALTSLGLEVYRWFKSRANNPQTLHFDNNVHNMSR